MVKKDRAFFVQVILGAVLAGVAAWMVTDMIESVRIEERRKAAVLEAQLKSVEIRLAMTRYELEHLKEVYGPLMDVLSSADIGLIKKIKEQVSPDIKEKSSMRTATAIVAASKIHGVPTETVLGVVEVESKFNAQAVSKVRCRGLMQLTSLIWKHYSRSFPTDKDVHDELMNTFAGVHLLADLYKKYDSERDVLLHYWGGHAAVRNGGGRYPNLVLAKAKGWRDVTGN